MKTWSYDDTAAAAHEWLGGFSICGSILLIDFGSTQQIVESTDPVPPISIAFQHNAVFAGFVSPTVVLSKKIPKIIDHMLRRMDSDLNPLISSS